ncbi:Uncharacterized protein BP5553_01005 [Venustampulla echinocandica]|uniref:Peptidase A22B, signal peptide peptidase n=1 Tax=Venustampulla echinocandica TaxID=2656787 RepID=A0A370TZS3_9HELO|nr:Uncharacterized protein BP5553_01005 [Venustampulla echinocandica]RDL41026.1 Uncharacterized protein BP5553_01005 [Venustampulla echinocandica]
MESLWAFFDGDSPVLQYIGKWGYRAYEEREMVQMYLHLILAALFPIYIGSHGSLRRPASAEAQKKLENADEEDDEIPTESVVEGLTPSDAIMFPVLAGITLAILYFIIKWLKDPALLNKILTWYFSGLGIFGVGKLAGDGLNVLTTFIFPSVWSSGDETYYIDPVLSQQITVEVRETGVQEHRRFLEGKTNPFPGLLSNIKFSVPTTRKLWTLRALLKNRWIFRGYLHGAFSLKRKVQLNDVVGLLIGVATIILYNTFGKAWWLTNLIGFGFCYGTLQLMTPTTFWTGSLVLAGLFIYDITMVFYTPLMVTVATSLDVPIKLVFPGPKRGGMLGLGDVVLPGIMMALALRFDLYLHYLRKQRSSNTSPQTIKSPYIEASSLWGERYWTRSSKSATTTAADGARFPKIYFNASVVGYIIGMVVTLIVLNVYGHAQPALLYLVPGVLGALWATAVVRGELKLMWDYSEAESMEPVDPQADDGKSTLAGGTGKAASVESKGSNNAAKQISEPQSGAKEDEHAHHVVLFSLSEPKHRTNRG